MYPAFVARVIICFVTSCAGFPTKFSPLIKSSACVFFAKHKTTLSFLSSIKSMLGLISMPSLLTIIAFWFIVLLISGTTNIKSINIKIASPIKPVMNFTLLFKATAPLEFISS